jgi:hypothetical protein
MKKFNLTDNDTIAEQKEAEKTIQLIKDIFKLHNVSEKIQDMAVIVLFMEIICSTKFPRLIMEDVWKKLHEQLKIQGD